MPQPDSEGDTAGLLVSPEGYLDLLSKSYMNDTEPADAVRQCSQSVSRSYTGAAVSTGVTLGASEGIVCRR